MIGTTETSYNKIAKIQLIFLFDTSLSMADKMVDMKNAKIDQLNKEFQLFVNFLDKIPQAKENLDISIITFGANEVKVLSKFEEISQLKKIKLTALGNTPMFSALKLAHGLLMERSHYYHVNDIRVIKSILVLITDGEATDFEIDSTFPGEFKRNESKEKFIFKSYFLGPGNIPISLKAFSSSEPKLIKSEQDFRAIFSDVFK